MKNSWAIEIVLLLCAQPLRSASCCHTDLSLPHPSCIFEASPIASSPAAAIMALQMRTLTGQHSARLVGTLSWDQRGLCGVSSRTDLITPFPCVCRPAAG